MVQFCPKCGTKDPDDKAAFCNKCGSRLPPQVPEKKEIQCPVCGTTIRDPQAVFCDTCGSRLPAVPPVQAWQPGARPAAPPPVPAEERCPSCGAPVTLENSDFCNLCGAYLGGAASLLPPPEPDEPYQVKLKPFPPRPAVREPAQVPGEKTGPGGPGAERPDQGREFPVQKKGRGPLLKWGLAAGVVVIIFLIIGASFSGMIPGFSHSSNATNGSALRTQTPVATERTTQTAAPTPTKTPAPPVPTAVITTTAPTTVPTTVSPNVTTTISTNVTTKAPANVIVTPTITNTSQPLSIGQSAYDGKGKLTVNEFSYKDKMSDPTPSYAVGKKYMIVGITYENLQQNETVDAGLSRMKLMDGGGFVFDPASDILLENPYTGISILPQEKRTGNLLFIVPPEATLLKLQYTFDDQMSVSFQLT